MNFARRLACLCAAAALCTPVAAQETETWPGFYVHPGAWDDCFLPWTEPQLNSCRAPAGGEPIGYIPFLAQIFVDRPEEDFLPAFREGKTLYEMQHVCGGALIAPEWVLTAAHCITKAQIGKGYKVRLGIDRIADLSDGFVFDIADVEPHPKFVSYKRDDIALVRIAPQQKHRVENPEHPVPVFFPFEETNEPAPRFLQFINFARPTSTPAARMPKGLEIVKVYGWGKTQDVEGDAPASKTYKVELTVLPNDFCERLSGYGPEKVFDTVFCASHPLRKTCRGDSGGPVLDEMGNIIGIVSWGKKKCSEDGQPGVYTRVAAYAEWIDGIIGDNLGKRRREPAPIGDEQSGGRQ